MSGGHFNYKQYELGHIADEIEQLIETNDSQELDDWGSTKGLGYEPDTIARFKIAVDLLRSAAIYVQRIDWLVSGDDGEDSFHRRLKNDLEKLA